MSDRKDRDREISMDSNYLEFTFDGKRVCIKFDRGRIHNVEGLPMTQALCLEESEEIQLLKILSHRQGSA